MPSASDPTAWYPPRTRYKTDGKQRIKCKTVILDRFDEAMLTFALEEAFGRVWIVDYVDHFRPPKDSPVRETLADLQNSSATLYLPVSTPEPADGKADWQTVEWLFFHFCRSRWIYSGQGSDRWAFDPPTLIEGRLCGNWEDGDAVGKAVIARAFRIAAKVTTTAISMQYPHLGITAFARGRSSDWYGWHAMEWCARKPGRMLNGRIRPAADFVPPQSAWYLNLREKVIARYGEELDDPGPPEIDEWTGPRAVSLGGARVGSAPYEEE